MESNLARFMCLKSRDNAPFKPFLAGVVWPCRRIFSTKDVTLDAARKMGDDIDLGL